MDDYEWANPIGIDMSQHEPTSWRPIDLTDAVNGGDIPAPEILKRTDGISLLYRGKVHWFQGEPESCKTWVACAACTQVLDADGCVLWIDFEDDERTVTARLKAMSVPIKTILDKFTYVRPDEPLGDRHQRMTAAEMDFTSLLMGEPFDLVIIDGVTEAMLTEGLNLNDNTDIAAFMRRLPRRLADTGAAVVGLDHVTKDREGRGRYAIGGQHKLAGLTGAAYSFDVVRPFARTSSDEPSMGLISILISKDRGGHVRSHAFGDRIATVQLTSWPDGGVAVALAPANQGQEVDLNLCRRIIDFLLTYEGASVRRVVEGVEGKAPAIQVALKWMASEERGWLKVVKVGQAHQHTVTEIGAETFGSEGG